MGKAKEAYIQKETEIGTDVFRQIEKAIILQTIDTLWMNHLDEIDYLRQGIGLRGYGQRDPLIEYKREAFNLFSHLMENMRSTTVRTIFKVSVVSSSAVEAQTLPENAQYQGAQDNVSQFGAEQNDENKAAAPQKPAVNKDKVGRNDPCPCGSGKKFKNCCGK